MECGACQQLTNGNDTLQCTLCRDYHCLNLSGALSKEYCASWIWPVCVNVTKRTKSSVTHSPPPARTPAHAQRVHNTVDNMNMSCDLVAADDDSSLMPLRSTVTMDNISMLLDQKLNATLTTFMQNFRTAIKEDLREMVKGEVNSAIAILKDDFTSTTDYICVEQSTLKSEIEDKAKTIMRLELENNRLQSDLNNLNQRLYSVEKISRSCNIEIQAAPETTNENVLKIFKKLCEIVHAPIEDNHILACRRVAKLNRNTSRPRNILISLPSPRLRDSVLSAIHRFNKTHKDDKLNTKHLDIAGESRPVFVAEHLSPEHKALNASVRKLAKEHKFKYMWVRNGEIFVRRDDNASAIHIKNTESLKKIHS